MATTTHTTTTSSSTTPADPPNPFPSRYEIRRLTEADIPVATAIVMHSNIFNSPLWTQVFPDHSVRVAKAYAGLPGCEYLVRHQVSSGHSFGVFDTEYVYKTASAKATGGACQWDTTNKPELSAAQLDDLIDSPIVSVALSYDGHNALDMEKLGPLLELLPLYGAIFHRFDITDPRDPASFKPTGPNQILMRNATATRTAAQGKGIMGKMANWLMAYAQGQGYKNINIECFDERVNKVWANPKAQGVSAQEVTAFRVEDYTVVGEESGRIERAFGGAVQRVSRVWVSL